MRRISSLAASLAAVLVLVTAGSTAVVSADSPSGQIEMGNIFRVRNITTNPRSAFVDPVTATCNDTVQFRVRIHNPGPDPITNVRVAATLDSAVATSHSSRVSITADNVGGQVVTDTAGVNLDKAGSLSFIPGSTELLDPNGVRLNGLPDGIITGGVGINIGTVGVSIQQIRSVQFRAKVSCPEQPKEKAPIKIRKIAEDSKGTELSAVPTNTFTFRVTCDGQTNTVTLNANPQAAGECNVGGTVTITENAVSGWTILSPSTQSFTVTSDGVTAVFKNRQVAAPVVKPAVTPPAKAAPKELPITGAGSAIALFTGVSTAAGVGHYLFRRYF